MTRRLTSLVLLVLLVGARPVAAAIAFVQNVKRAGAGTTTPTDFSGANGSGGLVVIILSGLAPVGTPDDSSHNTWVATTARAGAFGGEVRLYYVLNPTLTNSHTFTDNGATTNPSMCVLAFKNINAFDKQNGVNSDASSTAHIPSTTPTTDGTSVFIAGAGGGTAVGRSIDESFTLVDNNDLVGGVNYDSASAYFIQVSSGAKDPTFTNTTSGTSAGSMLVFSPNGAGPSSGPPPCGLRLLGVGCEQ